MILNKNLHRILFVFFTKNIINSRLTFIFLFEFFSVALTLHSRIFSKATYVGISSTSFLITFFAFYALLLWTQFGRFARGYFMAKDILSIYNKKFYLNKYFNLLKKRLVQLKEALKLFTKKKYK